MDASQWHGGPRPSDSRTGPVHIDSNMRVRLETPLGEPLELIAHCGVHAKMLCATLNACDLSDAVAAAPRVVTLLALAVSEELARSDHPEDNFQLLTQAFQRWWLWTLQGNAKTASAICRDDCVQEMLHSMIKVLILILFLSFSELFHVYLSL